MEKQNSQSFSNRAIDGNFYCHSDPYKKLFNSLKQFPTTAPSPGDSALPTGVDSCD